MRDPRPERTCAPRRGFRSVATPRRYEADRQAARDEESRASAAAQAAHGRRTRRTADGGPRGGAGRPAGGRQRGPAAGRGAAVPRWRTTAPAERGPLNDLLTGWRTCTSASPGTATRLHRVELQKPRRKRAAGPAGPHLEHLRADLRRRGGIPVPAGLQGAGGRPPRGRAQRRHPRPRARQRPRGRGVRLHEGALRRAEAPAGGSAQGRGRPAGADRTAAQADAGHLCGQFQPHCRLTSPRPSPASSAAARRSCSCWTPTIR